MRLLAILAVLGAHDNDEVAYIEASLERDGELLGHHFVDVDGDDVLELVLVRRPPEPGPDGASARELSVHRITSRGVEATPFWSLPVLDGAVAYGFADVRDEPGRELFFLAQRGVWSMSLGRTGYRDNLAPLVQHELLYDVPDPTSLDPWPYVFASDGGDRLLLPGRTAIATWAPGDDATYALETTFPKVRLSSVSPGRQVSVSGGGGSKTVARASGPLPRPFLADLRERTGDFLSSFASLRAPARLDVDGDGREDLVRSQEDGIAIHLGTADGFRETPDREERWPDYLDGELEFEWVDLEGDGDTDVVAVERANDGVENREMSVFVLLNDGERLLADEPHQVLRFEAAEVTISCADVDGDGRLDLALRKFELPSLLTAVSGLEFTLTHMLFRGEAGRRPFERSPVVKTTQTFDETNFEDVLKRRSWKLDCDGDGLADVVEIDLKGRISIRRLVHSSSFFGGESWEVEPTPWRRFPTAGNIEELEVLDLNGDGLADVVSENGNALTILLSNRRGSNR